MVSGTETVLETVEAAFKDFVHALEEGGYRYSVEYLLEEQSPEGIPGGHMHQLLL